MNGPQLRIRPVSFREACAYVAEHHRHHRPPRGHKFSIAVCDDSGKRVGVVIIGRPVARHFDDGLTLEALRVCTDGTPNACSALLGAAWRTARACGHQRLITYTLAAEGGASLRAAGWRRVAERPARPGWNAPSRPRTSHGVDNVARVLWEIATPASDPTGGPP